MFRMKRLGAALRRLGAARPARRQAAAAPSTETELALAFGPAALAAAASGQEGTAPARSRAAQKRPLEEGPARARRDSLVQDIRKTGGA